jgi:hypothetical protein
MFILTIPWAVVTFQCENQGPPSFEMDLKEDVSAMIAGVFHTYEP